jgi:hypothetical protein
MVPELSDSAALHLEHRKRVLRNEVKTAPDAVAELACSMLHHMTMMESIMRKATKRIAELELEALLGPPNAGVPSSSADGAAPFQ